MLSPNLFFKKPSARTMEVKPEDTEKGRQMLRGRQRILEHMNQAVRPSVGHPRFGFQTMLNQDSFAPLPTAPAIVGGNVDWTKRKITPATHFLHSKLSEKRPMNPPPAIDSDLKLREPNVNSIHTTI